MMNRSDGRSFTPAVPGMGLKAWLECDEVGAAAYFMARVMFGLESKFGEKIGFRGYAEPRDVAELVQCLKFVSAVTGGEAHLHKLRGASRFWSLFVDFWPVMKGAYHQDDDGSGLEPVFKEIRAFSSKRACRSIEDS